MCYNQLRKIEFSKKPYFRDILYFCRLNTHVLHQNSRSLKLFQWEENKIPQSQFCLIYPYYHLIKDCIYLASCCPTSLSRLELSN